MATSLLPITAAFGVMLCAGIQTPLSDQGDVVNLNVVALDSKAQPVTDLTPQDFVVKDSGKTRGSTFARLRRD